MPSIGDLPIYGDYSLGDLGDDVGDAGNSAGNWVNQNFLGGGVNDAYDRAITGVNEVIIPGYNQIGQQAYDRTGSAIQQGLGQLAPAYGAVGDYRTYMGQEGPLEHAYNTTANTLLGPTQSEWANLYGQSQLMGPSQSQQYGGQAAGYATGADASQGIYQQYQDTMQNPSNQANYAGNALANLSGPSQSQRQYGDMQSNLYGQGMMEQNASGLAGNLQGPLASNQMINALGAQGQTASGANYGAMQGMWTDAQAAQQGIRQDYRGQQGSLDVTSAEIPNTFRTATQGGQFFDATANEYLGPGIFERRMAAALGENDPLLARVRERGQDAINQQMAARGMYASGGALDALSQYNAQLDAENYRNLLDLSRQGQEAQFQRLGAGQGAAGAASGEALNRGGALQGIAETQRDLELREREMDAGQRAAFGTLISGAAGQADQVQNQRLGMQTNLAIAADQQNLANTMGQADIYQGADAGELARMDALLRGSGQADDAEIARIMSGQNIVRDLDQDTLARLGLGGQLASQADATQLDISEQLMSIGSQIDASTLARVTGIADMAQNADQSRLASLGLYLDTAGNVQQMNDQQWNTYLNIMGELGATGAGVVTSLAPVGIETSAEAQGEGLNAYGDALGLGVDQATTQQETNLGWLKTGLSVLGL